MLRVGLGRITPVNARTLPPASFLLNFADLGAGAVSMVESAGNATPTFVRATAAAAKLSTGLWKLDVASGVARYTYDGLTTAITTTGGYFPEGARTNSVLQARDLTNAAWTKSNLTTAKTSTGIDGAANSCTRCTASAGNGTALQAVVIASAAKAFGVWIKRITGVGEIDITLDNGSTWTNVTGSINGATFTLVQATQTLANPTVGIRIVTSADAIDVDVCQLEDGVAFISSPVSTTVAAVTRNADVLTYPTSPWLNAAAGTLLAQFRLNSLGGIVASQIVVEVNDGTTNERFTFYNGKGGADVFSFFAVDGGVTQADITAGNAAANTAFKMAGAYALNDLATSLNGAAVGTDTSATLPTVTTLYVGTNPSSLAMFGTLSSIRYFPIRLSNSVLQQITT